jgi:AcrR family transcriptional regulator
VTTPRHKREARGTLSGADARPAGKSPARLGRPRGGNSAETRQTILDAALRRFAEGGYASTTITAIAADVGLSTSSVYHYFDGKEQLYEAVFFAVAPRVWEGMAASVSVSETMVDAIEALMRDRGGARGPFVSSFLAGMPTVGVLHPEFERLLQARAELQDLVFRSLAELGLRTGELAGFTVDEATAVLQALVVGWFFERDFVGAERDHEIASVVKAFELMALGARQVSDDRAPPRPPPPKDQTMTSTCRSGGEAGHAASDTSGPTNAARRR